jgi:hypothetical protein
MQQRIAYIAPSSNSIGKRARRRRKRQRDRQFVRTAESARSQIVPFSRRGMGIGSEYGSDLSLYLNNLRNVNPYLACLVMPKYHICRNPDQLSKITGLYKTILYNDVVAGSLATNPADLGKFAFVFRPVLSSSVAINNVGGFSAQTWQFTPSADWTINSQNSAFWTFTADPNTTTMVGTPNVAGTAFTQFGLVRDYRPVAMSVWFQFTANELQNGGNVAMALLDGSLLQQYFGGGTPAPGPLQEYRNLSRLPFSYNGKLASGCYGFWKPNDYVDSSFRESFGTGDVTLPAQFDDSAEGWQYQSLVVSGQAQASGLIGRIETHIVYEISSSSTVPDMQPSPVHPRMVDHANMVLANVPTVMANEQHESFLAGLLKFAESAAPYIGGAIGGVFGPVGGFVGHELGNGVADLLKTLFPARPSWGNASKGAFHDGPSTTVYLR